MILKSRFIEMFGDHQHYSKVPLSSVLKQYYVPEKITNPESESFITLSSYGKGIKKREIKEGKTPVPFTGCRIKEGQFVSSRLHAKEGAFGIVPMELEGSVVSRDFPVFDIDSNLIDTDFLIASVSQESFYNQFMNCSLGSTTKRRIKEDVFLDYRITLPPLDVQYQFVHFVKQVDKSKAICKRIFESFDNLIKSRFIEMFGDIESNSKGWKCNKLGDLGTFKTGGTPSSKHEEYYKGSIPFISTPSLGPNYINETAAKYLITKEAVDSCATTLIPSGSLIIGTRINVGQSSINIVPMCTNQDIVSLTDVSKGFNLLFLKHCVDQYIPYLNSQKKGATIKGITINLLKTVQIPEVPFELQNEYVDFVKQVDKSKFIRHHMSGVVGRWTFRSLSTNILSFTIYVVPRDVYGKLRLFQRSSSIRRCRGRCGKCVQYFVSVMFDVMQKGFGNRGQMGL